MNNEIKIRRTTENDFPAIVEILRGLWFAHINAESASETEQRIKPYFELCAANERHTTIYVAEKISGEIAGYTMVHWLPYFILAGPEGYVAELFVRDSERGQGIGTKLLEAVKQEAKERGCARLSLLNVRDRESYQRGFYKKAGWQEREHVANFVLPLPSPGPETI